MAAPSATTTGGREYLSLLWPPGVPPSPSGETRLDREAQIALDLDTLLQVLTGGQRRREPFVTEVLTALCTDLDVLSYRQDIVADLLATPVLCDQLAHTLDDLTALEEALHLPAEWSIFTITHRLAELEAYIAVVVQLRRALDAAAVHSRGLLALRAHVQAVAETATFQALQQDAPTLRATLSQACSVTIGINLSPDLTPESAAILSISPERVEGRSPLLAYLAPSSSPVVEPRAGSSKSGSRPERAITPLRGDNLKPGYGTARLVPMGGRDLSPQGPLAQDLQKLLERVAAPVATVLKRYLAVNTQALASLGAEISFLLNGVTLIQDLWRVGLPVCRPEPIPLDARAASLDNCYNVSLALQMCTSDTERTRLPDGLVTNPVLFDATQGRVWVLTGPNRGGKTTYLRAVGLAHVLFQAGLYVPARAALLSPVDAIHTHFPNLETAQLGKGRLDDEAERLAEIFHKATPHSLILLNEVLAGTSASEAFSLAVDAMRGLHMLGTRAIYATHLHDLAASVAEINAQTPGDGTVGSLVAGAEEQETDGGSASHARTYRIRPGPPKGVSYASEIAVQHGISFAQLATLLRQRGVVTEIMPVSGTDVPPLPVLDRS